MFPARGAGNSSGIPHSCPKQGSVQMTMVALCGYPSLLALAHSKATASAQAVVQQAGKPYVFTKTKGS